MTPSGTADPAPRGPIPRTGRGAGGPATVTTTDEAVEWIVRPAERAGDPGGLPEAKGLAPPLVPADAGGSGAAGWFVAALGTLLLLFLGVDLALGLRDLYLLQPALGIAGGVLLAVACLALAVLTLKDLRAWLRFGRSDRWRHEAAEALAAEDPARIAELARRLARSLPGSPDPEALSGLSGLSARDALAAAERHLLSEADERALRETAVAARSAAIANAISPYAAFDMAFMTWRGMRLVRGIAAAYGMRPGPVTSWRIVRRALGAAVAAGATEGLNHMVSDMIGGAAAAVGSRAGQGVLAGLLTVRLGLATMDQCRPLPFTARPEPRIRDVVRQITGAIRRL